MLSIGKNTSGVVGSLETRRENNSKTAHIALQNGASSGHAYNIGRGHTKTGPIIQKHRKHLTHNPRTTETNTISAESGMEWFLKSKFWFSGAFLNCLQPLNIFLPLLAPNLRRAQFDAFASAYKAQTAGKRAGHKRPNTSEEKAAHIMYSLETWKTDRTKSTHNSPLAPLRA